jgi:hypothetical protein
MHLDDLGVGLHTLYLRAISQQGETSWISYRRMRLIFDIVTSTLGVSYRCALIVDVLVACLLEAPHLISYKGRLLS